jgi:hypothetical protein
MKRIQLGVKATEPLEPLSSRRFLRSARSGFGWRRKVRNKLGLNELIPGYSPSPEPISSSGLGGLMHGRGASQSMSLPRAMNALSRGDIPRPTDEGSLTDLQAPNMPTQPAPQPRRPVYQDELDAAAIDRRVDQLEMHRRIEGKVRAAVADQKWDVARRLAAAQTELEQSRTESHG